MAARTAAHTVIPVALRNAVTPEVRRQLSGLHGAGIGARELLQGWGCHPTDDGGIDRVCPRFS